MWDLCVTGALFKCQSFITLPSLLRFIVSEYEATITQITGVTSFFLFIFFTYIISKAVCLILIHIGVFIDEHKQKEDLAKIELERVLQEKDQLSKDLNELERSFSSVVKRLDRCKEVIEGFKKVHLRLLKQDLQT